MSSFGKFVFGALVGGAIGAAIGILLAPRSGEETRELIREELGNRYDDSVEKLRETRDHVVSDVKHKTAELTQKAKALSDEMEEVGRETLDKLGDKLGGKPSGSSSGTRRPAST